MSYRSAYKLTTTPHHSELIKQFANLNANTQWALDEGGRSNDEVSCDIADDLASFAKSHPEVQFTLIRAGEERDDVVVYDYLGNKYRQRAVIEPFDSVEWKETA